MKANYFWKVTLLMAAMVARVPIAGFLLAGGIGHILDMRWPEIADFFKRKFLFQKSSEVFVFLISYYCYILDLDPIQTSKDLAKEIITKDPKGVEELCFYYMSKYFKRKSKIKGFNNKIEEAVNFINADIRSGDNVKFFNLLETLFNLQTKSASPADLHLLKNIAEDLNIDYTRNYSYEEKHETREAPKASLTKKVSNAFAEFGFTEDNLPTLIALKKEYKLKVKQYHPDLQGKVTATEMKKAQEKLQKLNDSMDIAKKFLANR